MGGRAQRSAEPLLQGLRRHAAEVLPFSASYTAAGSDRTTLRGRTRERESGRERGGRGEREQVAAVRGVAQSVSLHVRCGSSERGALPLVAAKALWRC